MNYFITQLGKTPVGLPKAHLVPGAIVTVSPDLMTGEMDHSRNYWTVVGSNPGHVLVECGGHQRLIPIHRHHFYPAEHLINAGNV
ncbi:hypothetical protein ACUN0C_19090 [Faunimonas sp. B44]|uniref:hypothetical protein n=1 Tax=Faunimonas sp. B44 TaxID=3461493 RepID=UPI004044033E